MKDRERRFHETWLGLARPSEGLTFSVPVLADAQIAPEISPRLTTAFQAELTTADDAPRIQSLVSFFRSFLGYDRPGSLVQRAELPQDLHFYAAEGGQEIRPTFAIARSVADTNDPFAAFNAPASSAVPSPPSVSTPAAFSDRYSALIWDLTDDVRGEHLELDKSETLTGPWRYPPTAKFERLLRHTGIPVGFLGNGTELRLVYAPAGETTAHLTFRVKDMADPAGRPILAALDLLGHARRAYGSAQGHTLEGLLAESRRRQADVTEALAEQVFEAVETLLAGFEQAALRDAGDGRPDWLRAALEAEGDHLYQGVLGVVLRLVFLLYAEDQGLMPDDDFYAEHLSVFGLYERLSADAGAHPESMHHRFGAYGQLLALFRAVYFGARHGTLDLPPHKGKLFDPNAYPFLEGGLPDWTSAVHLPEDRARATPPSLDDGTLYRVLHRLVVLDGQRLSYRTLDVEQIGSVYESLMGYHVERLVSPAVRLGKHRVWVETEAVRKLTPTERKGFWKETCGLNSGPATSLEAAVKSAGTDDEALLAALAEQAPGKKDDAQKHRAPPGRLVLQPGEERRRTGTHYTPRTLTERIVKRTLEPLLACMGEALTAEQILELKICDPAMGSGAFLVAACRELAREIVKAWTRSGELARIAEAYENAEHHAQRLVAQRCLYGVDKNAAAVELAKLSLWLVTMSRGRPFTFLDHALRHGDSLVGLDLEQIKAFHWKPKKQLDFCEKALTDALEQATGLRSEILELADREDAASQAEKRRLLEFSEQSLARIRLVADVCVGAFFAEQKDKARETERRRRVDLVESFLRGNEETRGELEELAEAIRREVSPFHWMIEFPEVFFEARPDPLDGGKVNGAAFMEAFVGNPPFAGKNTVIDGNAAGYLDWLAVAHEGAHGNSDLSAHFFRRATTMLGRHGALGLIATNTIAQGDTRTTGLQAIVARDWELYDATNSMPWPGAAAVTVSVVHAAHGNPGRALRRELDGAPVSAINSRLRPKPERPDPRVLEANAKLSFQGSIVLGMGFTLTPEEREALVQKDPRNAERIFPYLGGEEVNTSPTQRHDRYVISFGQMELAEAENWPDLIRIVREKVKPERDRIKDAFGKKFWWQFLRTRPEMYAAIAPLERCLVTLFTAKHLAFSLVRSSTVFANTLWVFPFDRYRQFAVLQSRVHNAWARFLSSSMKTDLRYASTDCFETFPFPKPDPRTVIEPLEKIGEALYETRARFMLDTGQGLTKTYNALKDPRSDDSRVLELRRLHEEMDRAVLDAFGWSDVVVPPYCPLTKADEDAVKGFEDEVIDRLYLLNAERAGEEAGLQRPKQGSEPRRRKALGAPPKQQGTQGKLF